MDNCKKPLLFLFFCIWCGFVSSQPSLIKIIADETDSPIAGAIIIVKPLDSLTSVKREFYFTNERGEVLNKYPHAAKIHIESFGYQPLEDTVEPAQTYVFHLKHLNVDLNEIVVTGQYDINTTDKSVYKIKVIDQQRIRSMAAQNLTDLLQNELNTRLSQDNILGSSTSIDGISGQNVKILIDGVSMIGRENGNIDLNQINLNNVEKVEIIEGPMSVSYGTDAIGGLINIVTRKSSSYPWEADANLYYESVGTYNADGAFFWRKKNNAVTVSGGRNFFEGFSTDDSSRFMEWKPRLQYFGTFTYNYFKPLFNLTVKSDYFNQEIQNKGNPVLTPYQAYAFDDYYFTRRFNEYVFAEWRLKNNARVQLNNAYSNYRHIKNTYRKDLVTLDQILLSAEGTQDTSIFDAFSFRGTYSSTLPARRLNYQAGYDIDLQSGNGEKLTTGVQRIDDFALFGSAEYRFGSRLFIRPGLRASYNTRYGAPVTPSFNIKYDISDSYSIRASYARGFRAPSLKELDLYFVDVNHYILGNDTLKAEFSNNYRLSLTSSNAIGNYKIKADASFFYNDIRNIITLALVEPTTQLYTYINIDKYRTAGGTFTLTLKSERVTLNTGFSLTGLYNTLAENYNVEEFSWTPEFLGDLNVSFPKPNVEFAVYFKNTGTTPGFNLDSKGEVYQTFIDPYTMLDITLTKYFLNKRLALATGVKNLLNVTDVQTNALGNAVHSAGGDEIPYAIGRFIFGSLRFKIYGNN